jgi:hypothetical protein
LSASVTDSDDILASSAWSYPGNKENCDES